MYCTPWSGGSLREPAHTPTGPTRHDTTPRACIFIPRLPLRVRAHFLILDPSVISFVTMYSSVPSCAPSLPYPDSLIPPNGLLDQQQANSNRSSNNNSPSPSKPRSRSPNSDTDHSHHRLGDGARVGADHTHFEGLGYAPDPVRVLGEEVPGEADLGVVGERLWVSAGSRPPRTLHSQ